MSAKTGSVLVEVALERRAQDAKWGEQDHWDGTGHDPIGFTSGYPVLTPTGTTEWKLGPHARALATEAKWRGKWLHMGRVNSERRYRYAAAIGCDSVDGTYLVFGPGTNLPKLLAWTRNDDQYALFGGVPA